MSRRLCDYCFKPTASTFHVLASAPTFDEHGRSRSRWGCDEHLHNAVRDVLADTSTNARVYRA